jgi:hypothetical protein
MHRTRLPPALGKGAEAKRLLADHVRQLQGPGQRLTLSELIFSADAPMLLVTQVAPELADVERARKSRLTDPDFQARAGQVLPLLRDPPRSTLWESVVEMPANPPPTTISQIVFAYPAPGKDRELEGIARELIQELQKMGQLVSLWRRMYSSDGPMLQLFGRYADLADLDRARKARAELSARMTPALEAVSRAPMQHRLAETIVPLPPA